MPRSRAFERAALSVLLVAALAAFAAQLAFDRPALGALGLLLLAVPGYAISRSIGPRPSSWPEILLVTLGATLAIMVVGGALAGLSPAGLDARTIAVVELVVLAAIAIAWLGRISRGRVGRRQPGGRRIALGSLFLAGVGLVLAGAGVAVATRAAQDQQRPGFVQFWSLPARPSIGASVGVRNMSGVPLDCAVTIDRPDRLGLAWNAGRVAQGQTVLGLLPQAEADETAPWRLALSCTGAGDAPIERQVSIEPPR
jgi:hypothetical protein